MLLLTKDIYTLEQVPGDEYVFLLPLTNYYYNLLCSKVIDFTTFIKIFLYSVKSYFIRLHDMLGFY